jgi:hydrogenase large subunit
MVGLRVAISDEVQHAARGAGHDSFNGLNLVSLMDVVGPGENIRRLIDRLIAAEDSSVIDKFRQIGGSLSVYCQVDLSKSNSVVDVAAVATKYQGYETLLLNRGLGEAGLISSTASGICGGVHAATSAQCLEMALGVKPPPLAVIARNLLLCCQYLSDNVMHLFILGGSDYSQETVETTNPDIWEKARVTGANHESVHGYKIIGAIMTALNRDVGPLFIEAIKMVQMARSAYILLAGKYPFSESIFPGGVAFTLDADRLRAFEQRMDVFIDYAKRCARVWDDIFDFFYECDPAFRDVGRGPANLMDFGQWDNDEHYDATLENCDNWGEKRWSTPGVVIDGTLVTTRLTLINSGLEESVDRSFYEPWTSYPYSHDPVGNPLSRNHPWNKTVHRNRFRKSSQPPYSWATALTWRHSNFEVGAYTRLYISALAKKIPSNQFVESTGRSLILNLPERALPMSSIEWSVPAIWNAFERNRARAYAIGFNLAVVMENSRRAKDLVLRGEHDMASSFKLPSSGARLGVGFGGAGRGLLAHWAVLDGDVITNYQVCVPSRINGGPRTPWGQLGPCERALLSTPILETGWCGELSRLSGIDLVRVLQSFDLCMSCHLHVSFSGADKALDIEVNSSGLPG